MQADFNRPVLAIDTGTSHLSLALRADGETRLFHQEVGSRQSELILPEIRTLFHDAGITAADLGAIVYAKGPGAFTGLRIGIGVAQGLATPFDTPLIGVPSLAAAASLPPPQSCILAAMDARMGEVFYAWFDTLNCRRLSDYQVGRAADITLPEGHVFSDGIGSAFALENRPPFTGKPEMPTAADFLNLAAEGGFPAVAAAHAELLYVRNKIAMTAKEQAERRARL